MRTTTNKTQFAASIASLRAQLAQERAKLASAAHIASKLPDCGCTDGSFIVGCTHRFRRLRAVLSDSNPVLNGIISDRDKLTSALAELVASLEGRVHSNRAVVAVHKAAELLRELEDAP